MTIPFFSRILGWCINFVFLLENLYFDIFLDWIESEICASCSKVFKQLSNQRRELQKDQSVIRYCDYLRLLWTFVWKPRIPHQCQITELTTEKSDECSLSCLYVSRLLCWNFFCVKVLCTLDCLCLEHWCKEHMYVDGMST